MELLNKTILPEKQSGDGLKYSEINSLNKTVNSLVDAVNIYLKKYCDVSAEFGGTYTTGEAIRLVPASRRNLGMTVSFISSEDGFAKSVVFIGKDLDTWTNTDFWVLDNNVVDGGTWE